MTVTTIKVSTETRDRLKRQARATGSSLGDHVSHLADLADRAERFDRLRHAVKSASDRDTASHQAEAAQWETTELTDAD